MSLTSFHAVADPRRRGFWLKTKRFVIIPRLRVRFCYFFRFLFKSKWKFSSGQALKLVKRGILRSKDSDEDGLKRRMVSTGGCRSRSYYYASSDAISDCLEYIKMSAINSADHRTPLAGEILPDT